MIERNELEFNLQKSGVCLIGFFPSAYFIYLIKVAEKLFQTRMQFFEIYKKGAAVVTMVSLTEIADDF